MAAKKEHVDVVLPTSGNGVEYEVISRQVTENAQNQWPDIKQDAYDEIIEVRKRPVMVIQKKFLKPLKLLDIVSTNLFLNFLQKSK